MKKYELLSDFLNVDPNLLSKNNVLNTFIDNDSGYYMCLESIPYADLPEFFGFESKYVNAIIDINNLSVKELKLKLFSEPQYIHLGEVIYGFKGKGMRYKPIKQLKEEVQNNLEFYKKVENFEILSHISPQIGRDALNDFLSNVYLENLLLFTENKCKELNINNLNKFSYNGKEYLIKTYQSDTFLCPIIFYPLSIMKKYVYALTYNDLFTLGYEHRTSIHRFDKDIDNMSKEKFIKSTPVHTLSNLLKRKEINYESLKELRNKKNNEKYNNIDIYNLIKEELTEICLSSSLMDNPKDISDFIVTTVIPFLKRLINIDIGKKRKEKLICTDNYKQCLSFICARINSLLDKKSFLTRIIITRNNIYVLKINQYYQIVIRNAYNSSCVDEVSKQIKLKTIKQSKKMDHTILICDGNKLFNKFINQIPPENKNKFIVISN